MGKLLHEEQTYYLRGAGFKIHSELKGGHSEETYETALAWVFERDGVAFRRQTPHYVAYKGQQVGSYRSDLIIDPNAILVEVKVAPEINAIHKAQTLSYLRVTDVQLGLIMNFGAASMQFERLPNFMRERQAPQWQIQLPPNTLYPELTDKVLAAVHEVHSELGPGFLHPIYRQATQIELATKLVKFDFLERLPLLFQQKEITTIPTSLLLVNNRLLLATVALSEVTSYHTEKLRWAMKVTNCRLGLIVNFYPSQLDIRFIRTP